MSDEGFISRWSRRKLQAREAVKTEPPSPQALEPVEARAPVPEASPQTPEALPDVESLTPESDFTRFMQPDVNPATRRDAVKRLFQDPRYNVMDGLDVYIDDYSKPDPLPEGWLEKMTQMSRLGEYKEPELESEAPAPAVEGEGGAQLPAAGEAPAPLPAQDAPPDTPVGGSEPDRMGK